MTASMFKSTFTIPKTDGDLQLQPQNGQKLVFGITKGCRFTAVIQTNFILQLQHKTSVNVCLGS